MTPSQRAKWLGAKSLQFVASEWGTTVQALHYQFRENPKKFDIIVSGVVALNAYSATGSEIIKQEKQND